MFIIWMEWRQAIESLRRGFSRNITFYWFSLSLMAMMMRPDKMGVTGFVRVLNVHEDHYKQWLDSFQSSGIRLDMLSSAWHELVNEKTSKKSVLINGRPVYVGDGIKAPKEGFRMPGVKSLHQESNNNSKPEYIMGHSCQVVAKLIESNGQKTAIPIIGKIHEGYVESNRDKRTLYDKFISLVNEVNITGAYLLLDAYYCNRKIFGGLLESDNHTISRMRISTVAFEPPEPKAGRGRPKKYGKKIKLQKLFDDQSDWQELRVAIYNDDETSIKYLPLDLIWKPAGGRKLRFILVSHPTKGKAILVTTDLTLESVEIIKAYAMRFKIEVAFKEAVHTVGIFSYRFWMRDMDKKRRGDGDDYLHKKDDNYRQQYIKKISAYNAFIQAGLIAQGFLQLMSHHHRETIWANYSSWMRTMNLDANPSEAVVADTLKSNYNSFLNGLGRSDKLKKFFKSKLVAKNSATGANLAA